MIERSFFFYSFYAIITFDKSWWKLGDRVAKVNDLKQENKIKIRECLYDGQIWTKNDLAYKTNLSLATTTNILQEMLKSHEIEYVSDS